MSVGPDTPGETTATLARRARAAFVDALGREPDGLWAAPGRINVIGEHTDYSDGLCMPMAIDREVVVAASRRPDAALRVRSLDLGETAEIAEVGAARGWAAYPAGVAWALRAAGHAVGGAELVVASAVPAGAGLSSSAALECATGRALADLYGAAIDPIALARLAQRAENEIVGVPCGIMDQVASSAGRAGHALLLDVRTLSVTPIALRLEAAGLALLVVDTRTRHAHAGNDYAVRRAEVDAAAARLGVRALRDVAPADLDRLLLAIADQPALARRARHVVTEIERVERAVAVLAAGDPAALGPLLVASHVSLRDDFEVSCAELDLGVDSAIAAGALGARMVGGGFGGSLLALVEEGRAAAVEEAVAAAFGRAGLAPPGVFRAVAADGARRLAPIDAA